MELTKSVDYEEWYEKNATELWATYHEQGANYDQDYEEWCEKQYEDAIYCDTCKYKHYPHNGGWCYMFREKPKSICLYKGIKQDLTCYNCDQRDTCKLVDDPYNTNGDCLALK